MDKVNNYDSHGKQSIVIRLISILATAYQEKEKSKHVLNKAYTALSDSLVAKQM